MRAKQQPAKHEPRYANEAEAINAHCIELMVQIHGPEAVYGDDDEGGEFHPYFRNRKADDWTPDAK